MYLPYSNLAAGRVSARLFVWLATAIVISIGLNVVCGQTDKGKLQPGQLMREGTRIESRSAVCRFNGERLNVDLEEFERPILALENLAAQRILDTIRNDPNDDQWLLTGTITEFRGSNYLLLERVKRDASNKPTQ